MIPDDQEVSFFSGDRFIIVKLKRRLIADLGSVVFCNDPNLEGK